MLSQDRINLMLATMPISLTGVIDQLPNLSYQPDARTELDRVLDSYPSSTIPEGVVSKPLHGHYKDPIMLDIVDYLRTERPTITVAEVESVFGVTSTNVCKPHDLAAELLYRMATLNILRAYKYATADSSNLYTLRDYQLKLADIPNSARNERILDLHAKGYLNSAIADAYGISVYVVRRILKQWPAKRAELLAPPTN